MDIIQGNTKGVGIYDNKKEYFLFSTIQMIIHI